MATTTAAATTTTTNGSGASIAYRRSDSGDASIPYSESDPVAPSSSGDDNDDNGSISSLNATQEGDKKMPATMTTTTMATTTAKSDSKRPAATTSTSTTSTSTTTKVLTDKKRRRLEKNRLSARECRRRKKEATEDMQRQIILLDAENLRLRLQLQIGEEAAEHTVKEQEKVAQEIDDLLKSGASEAEIHEHLEDFKEKHADFGKSRRSALEFHLRNIRRLLMPTQTTMVAIKAMQGGESALEDQQQQQHHHHHHHHQAVSASPVADPTDDPFGLSSWDIPILPPSQQIPPPPLETESHAHSHAAYPMEYEKASINSTVSPSSILNTDIHHDVADAAVDHESLIRKPKALFQHLVNYLEVTPQQAIALKDSRFVALEMDDCLEKALQVWEELRNRLFQTGNDLELEFDTVRSILTPTQAAKFLVWVAKNAACMHMLNQLWDRVYPSYEGESP